MYLAVKGLVENVAIAKEEILDQTVKSLVENVVIDATEETTKASASTQHEDIESKYDGNLGEKLTDGENLSSLSISPIIGLNQFCIMEVG